MHFFRHLQKNTNFAAKMKTDINLDSIVSTALRQRAMSAHQDVSDYTNNLLYVVLGLNIKPDSKTKKQRGLSDDELAEELSAFPSFDETKYQEPSDEQWEMIVKSQRGKLAKGLEKWL